MEAWFNENLLRENVDNQVLLDDIKHKVMDTVTNKLGPYLYIYIIAGGNQILTIAELIAPKHHQVVFGTGHE